MALKDADTPEKRMTSESREPTVEDLVELCTHLNAENAQYVIIGGFAMRAAGFDRHTMDVDLLIDVDVENERRVLKSLEYLPDQAVCELKPGEVNQYTVVRIADEIVIDLMKSACGVSFQEASDQINWIEVAGVSIPFASPELLIRLKQNTHREKDAMDVTFLKRLLA